MDALRIAKAYNIPLSKTYGKGKNKKTYWLKEILVNETTAEHFVKYLRGTKRLARIEKVRSYFVVYSRNK